MHIAYIRQLKNLYPNCRIGVLTNDRSRPIYECSHLVDELINDTFFQCLKQRNKWQLYLDFYETYNSRHILKTALLSPEATMIFHKTPKTYYNTDTLRNYTFHCPPPNGAHMASLLQTSVLSEYFLIPKPDVSLDTNYIAQNGKHYWQDNKLHILIAPQGSIAKRKIPPQEITSLLNCLNPQIIQKCQFLLCNTQGGVDYLTTLKMQCPNLNIALSPPTDLHQYLSLLAASDLVISVDSGSAHLACAFKRPLLCFFANNTINIAKWHPLAADGVPMKIVFSKLKNSIETHSFSMEEAIIWLEQTLKTLSTRLKN
ncbi:glycosyltransferase family 9 protein [Neisseria flavescens]|uniref:glycosyltransferase family 9 protein n=1 Tax=Neisseria flavescens TaxID=484 RepID=UPI0013E2C1E5|nr:glycosyltransferase family 9 protein [Neisseria flavescens]